MLRSPTHVKTLSVTLAFGVLAGLFNLAGSARADLPQEQGHVNLQTQANVRITLGSDLNLRQPSVASAGDVNGDGIDDLIVGASPPGSMPGTPNNSSGAAFVIFGKETLAAVDPGQLGENGFRISHSGSLRPGFGRSVAGAGDVNGDGLDDLIIGEPDNTSGGLVLPGAAYIVFGKQSTAPVNAAALGDGGFKIEEGYINSVAGAGDVNQDGLADVIIGQYGSTYVVHGKRSPDDVNLANLGDQGFRIAGSGWSVAGVDDVNGDGIPDLMVGAPSADPGGVAHVIFGKGSTGTVYPGNLGNDGFSIRGEAGASIGQSVAGAGDLNGDGLADVIVGAPYADHNGRIDSGSAYVVNGKRSPDDVNLANIGTPGNTEGFRIDGAVGQQPGWPSGYSDKAGVSVSGAGDINGDGKDDAVVGAIGAYPRELSSDGAAYVVYGGATTNVALATLGARGIQMDGDGSDYNSVGWTVSGAGDFNGDGRSDVAVGSAVGSFTSATSHSAYIVYGFESKAIDPDDPDGPDDPKAVSKAQATSGQSDSCTRVLYENRLEVPREVRLADLVNGKGIKVRASANRQSLGDLTVEITGRKARYYKMFGKLSRNKDKTLARMKVRVGGDPKDLYVVANGKARKLIKRALRLKNVPNEAKLKLSLVTRSVVKPSLKRLNTQTVRALRRGKVKRTDTYVQTRPLCGASLVAKVKGPKETTLSSLTTRKGKKGSGTELKISCSKDCTATVGYRLWGRYEVGLKFRKPGQKKGGVFSKYKVKLNAGEEKTLRLDEVVSKKQRRLLVRGAKKRLYKSIKFKYFLEARTEDGRRDSSAGTTRVRLRFN